MLTSVAVAQGNVVTEGLNAWYDFGDTACFNPTLYTGSIAESTPFFNLAPNQAAVSGSITGAVNWSTAFGGCLNLTNNNTSTLQYQAGLSASFTIQSIITPGTDANPDNNWSNDGGAWPNVSGTNGFKWAQQYAASPGNNLIPILAAGASYSTLPTSVRMPSDGWNGYARFPNVYTFTTNGTNQHITYMNNVNKATDTTTRTRGNGGIVTINLNYDQAISSRHGLGRIVAYLHYNRQLSDGEIYQNVQYYLNRIGTK
jgi:hypothetical protein